MLSMVYNQYRHVKSHLNLWISDHQLAASPLNHQILPTTGVQVF